MGVGSGQKEALAPPCISKIDIFYYIFCKNVVYLDSNGKKEISPFVPTVRNSLASPGTFYHCPTPGT